MFCHVSFLLSLEMINSQVELTKEGRREVTYLDLANHDPLVGFVVFFFAFSQLPPTATHRRERLARASDGINETARRCFFTDANLPLVTTQAKIRDRLEIPPRQKLVPIRLSVLDKQNSLHQ